MTGLSRLLVVDDEESVAVTIGEVLRRSGYRVDTCFSGAEAVARLDNDQYDLVLTDLNMQDMDGVSLLRTVREQAPLTISIVLTGYASLESAIAAIRHGAYDYLVKPCMISDMKLTIERALEHRRLKLAEREAMQRLELVNFELEQKVKDRTDELRRLNEDLVRANHSKDLFFATLSHELRTPINAILGWTHLLRTRQLDDRQKLRALEIIDRNARQQAQLISDVLDISAIVAGKLRLEKQPTDLVAVTEAAVDSMRPSAEDKQIRLETVFERSAEPIFADADRLQQVISNLISNALKFTPSGGRIRVTVTHFATHAQIEIADTGVGIPASFLPHVFESFAQGETVTTKTHRGLGLGLAIVRHITELHDGKVWAESAGEGEGSTFTVRLPLSEEIQDQAGQKGPAASDLGVPSNLAGLTILVVEDERDTLELVVSILEDYGAQVLRAECVSAALELLAEQPPDVLLSDIGLPEEDGYSLIRRVRTLGMKLPAAALTAFAGAEDRVRAVAAGFNSHIAKPVDPMELVSAVASLAGR